MFLNVHMTTQCPFPLARAAKQQIFRSYCDNAIQVAAILKEPSDVLAEVEWAGPREATEVVAEISVARKMAPASLSEFRRNRAQYYRTLNTLPASFEDYLANITTYYAARRAYLDQWISLGKALIMDQWCDKIVGRALQLKLPDTVFLLFHVGTSASMMVLMDLGSGKAAPFPMAFGEGDVRAIHDEYQQAFSFAESEEQKTGAIDKLLARYETLLAPVLEPFLKFLPGKHLKIFSRLQMNAVPFHALRFKGKYLIDHCAALSYGQTLGLFLENHGNQPETQQEALRLVVGSEVPWYEVLLPEIRDKFGSTLREERQVSWPQLMESMAGRSARDTLFACHGEFDPSDPERSSLQLGDESVAFSQVFEELDLRGCRSVFMGACESGLARANIGAEYIGLPSAMLSSGVRYVTGALWTIPQVSTAVLVDRYLNLIRDGSRNVCDALCQAQREVMSMTNGELAAWVSQALKGSPQLDAILKEVSGKSAQPYAHPYFWAGLAVTGDV